MTDCSRVNEVLNNPDKMTKETFLKNLFTSFDDCVVVNGSCVPLSPSFAYDVASKSYTIKKDAADKVSECLVNIFTDGIVARCAAENTKNLFIFLFFNAILFAIVVYLYFS
jgi:hypothetical protein